MVMQAARESKVSTMRAGSATDGSSGGLERLVLALALLLPLAVIVLALAQLPGTSLASPSNLIPSDTGSTIFKRPVSSNAAPPPTLAPPTATPRATTTPVALAAPVATPTPQKGGTYTVQPGDELKHIAADYQVSIWKIIAANDIPNPDSLKIGQVLSIPSE